MKLKQSINPGNIAQYHLQKEDLMKVEAKQAEPAISVEAETEQEKKTKKKRLTREDFKTWAEWCDFQAAKCDERMAALTERKTYWIKVRENEQLTKVEKKQKKIEKYKAMLEKLEAELAETATAE